MEHRRIRVGIIGQGRSGRDIHVKTLHRPEVAARFELAAITDQLPERCQETAAEFPQCRVYPDYRAMLQDHSLELIVNASFSDQHVPISVEALEAGFHVLCEKPLAACVAEVDRAEAAARRAGKVFAVFQEARFDATFQKILEICRSGVLGRIAQVRFTRNGFSRRWDWQTLVERNGGALLNTGSHPLDQALVLFGNAMPERIFCVMDHLNSAGTAEDHVKLVFSSPGRPVIDLEVSAAAPYSPPRFQVYGERGGATATPGVVEWKYYRIEDAPPHPLVTTPLPNRAYCSEKLEWYENRWADTGSRGAAWMGEKLYRNLFDAIRNGAPLIVTIDDVRRQIAVIEECRRQNPAFALPPQA